MRRIEDPSLPPGTEKIVTAGVPAKRVVVNRTVLDSGGRAILSDRFVSNFAAAEGVLACGPPLASETRIETLPTGWSRSDVPVTLLPVNASKTYYVVNGVGPLLYTAPFSISDEGVNTLEYWSVNPALVEESPRKFATVRIDKTGTAVRELRVLAVTTDSTTITWTGTDPLSGVREYRVRRALRGGPLQDKTVTPVNTFCDSGLRPNTEYVYGVTAVDTAGNVSAEATILVKTGGAEPSRAVNVTTNFAGKAAGVRTITPAYKGRATIEARLTDSGGVALSNKPVVVQQYKRVGSAWQWVDIATATGSPTAPGTYTWSSGAIASKTLFRFRVAADAFTDAVTGLEYTVYPNSTARVSSAPKSVRRNATAKVTGYLEPRRKAGSTSVAKLKVYKYNAKSKKYVYKYSRSVKIADSPKYKTRSVFTKSLRFTSAGKYLVRLQVTGNSLNSATLSTVSGSKVIRVR
jgi:hypothetical protein